MDITSSKRMVDNQPYLFPRRHVSMGFRNGGGRTMHHEAAYVVTSMDIFQLVEITPIDFYLLCPL